METLPKIKKSEFDNIEDTWGYLFVILEKYFDIMDKDKEAAKYFNAHQHTLLAYNYFYGEVCNGGFIQLVQNGYGPYIFEGPLSKTLKEWGVTETAEIIEKATAIYDKYKNELTKETNVEEFSELYEKITDFTDLEDRYYEIMDDEAEKLKNYVKNNLDNFCVLV